MGDNPKQPGDGGEDLLSKLFEDDPEGTELGVAGSGAQPPFGGNTRVDKDRLSQTEFLHAPKTISGAEATQSEQVDSATDLQFQPEQLQKMMDTGPLADDQISFFDRKPPAEANHNPDSTMILDTQDLVEEPSEDPIDQALAGAMNAPAPSPTDDILNLDAPSEISSSDFSPRNSDEFTATDAGPSEKSEVKAEDFADVFSQEPIQVANVQPNSKKGLNISWKPLARAAGVLIPVLGGLYFLHSTMKSDAGLMGYRLEGFSLVRAYHPPSEIELAEFDKIFQESDRALLEDSPADLMAGHTKLQSIIEKDERNAQAVSRMLEHAAALIYWYGTGSSWARTYDEDMSILTQVGKHTGKFVDNIFAERAKARRSMAVGDWRSALSSLEKSIPRLSDTSDLSALMMVQLAWANEDRQGAQAWLSKVKDQKSKTVRYWSALVKDNQQELMAVGAEGYLPARVEALGQKILRAKSDERARSLKEAESLQKEVAEYPNLNTSIAELRADLLQLDGQGSEARKAWKELTASSVRKSELWQKIAQSAEKDALWDEALEAYQQLEKMNILNEASIEKYAELLRVRGRLVDAGSVTSRGLEKFSKSTGLHATQGRISWDLYQVDAAKEAFQKALAINEKYEPAILGLVEIAMSRREYLEATNLLKKIPPESAEYSKSLVTLARLELQRGNPDQAEENFKKALKVNPKVEEIYPALVDLQLRQERDAEAEALLGDGEKVLGRSPYLALSRARLFQFQKKYAEALEVLAPALKSHDHLTALHLLEADLLIDSGKTQQAAQKLTSLLNKQARDPDLGYLRAKLQSVDSQAAAQDLNSGEAAIKLLDSVIRQSDQEKYRLLMAKISLQVGERPVAQEQVDATLRLNSKSALAMSLQGDLAMDAGNYESAARSYKLALQSTKFRTELYAKLAEAFKQLNQPGQALQFYQKVTQERPNDAQAHLELGKLYNAEGRLQGALLELKKAVKLDSKLSEAYYFLGFVQKELGDERGALSSFEQFLSLRPDSTESATIRDEVYFLKNGGSGN